MTLSEILDEISKKNEIDERTAVEKWGKIYKWTQLYTISITREPSGWERDPEVRETIYTDIAGATNTMDMRRVAIVAAQLAAGILNLGILEDRLVQICREELAKAWPII